MFKVTTIPELANELRRLADFVENSKVRLNHMSYEVNPGLIPQDTRMTVKIELVGEVTE